MSTTEAPAVTYALPTSSDGAQAIIDALGLEQDEVVQYRQDNEAPDDLRNTLYDAISHGFDQQMGGWELLPRKVHRREPVLRVKMVPVLAVYEAETEVEPEQPPRQRVLTMMDEYHQEAREDYVPLADILQGTPGDEATVLEAVQRLEREGEVYTTDEDGDEYRRVGWS